MYQALDRMTMVSPCRTSTMTLKLNCVNKLFACVQTSPFKLARFRRPIGKKITLKTSAAISKIINPAFFYNVILKCSRISLLG